MNEESFNMSMRKFLKQVGVSSQQQLEKAVRDGLADGSLAGRSSLRVKMVLTAEGVPLDHMVEGTIDLE